MFLGATIALSVALTATFVDTIPITADASEPNRFLRFLIDRSLEATLTATPVLIALAIVRMYLHLLRLAGIAYVHTYDSRAGRAERDEQGLFD